jgi:hypothetical protein
MEARSEGSEVAGRVMEPRNGYIGSTHYWARSRRGYWVIKRKTPGKRLRRAQKALWQWCRSYRSTSLPELYRQLCQKLRGHNQYYGIRGNYRRLDTLCKYAAKA